MEARARLGLFGIEGDLKNGGADLCKKEEAHWGQRDLLRVIYFFCRILGFIVFTIFPVVMSFYYSLTDYDGGDASPNLLGYRTTSTCSPTGTLARPCGTQFTLPSAQCPWGPFWPFWWLCF